MTNNKKKLTPQLINDIFSDMHNGIPITRSLKERGVSNTRFFSKIERSPSLLASYAIAQNACAEALAGEIIEISDKDPDFLRARNRIDARKWYASKLRPSKFGDRIDVNITQIVDISQALLEAKNRTVLANCYQKNGDNSEPIEVIEESNKDN